MMDPLKNPFLGPLTAMLGAAAAPAVADRVLALCDKYRRTRVPSKTQMGFSEKDTVLITYGDTLYRASQAPLAVLGDFAETRLKDVFSHIHLLPFFPYSSDDGFSVTDYHAVHPDTGSWFDVDRLGGSFQLMFDYVLNHISAQSDWFSRYLRGEKGFERLVIEADPDEDLSRVTRPRALPLLTPFTKADGSRVHVWTTFSADQVDINFADPDTLLRMLDVLLAYVQKGARIVRLDAIAYLWKKIGTPCIHLPETHAAVKLFRQVLDRVAPEVIILTETNVPHRENISYFGDNGNEAQMVYNFTLPPLLLYTIHEKDTTALSRWASTLGGIGANTTFFNFTASHDGIGVRPLEGIVPPEAVEKLAAIALKNGGRVSVKNNPDGTQSPYELNITYIDALKAGGENPHDDPFLVDKFAATQAAAMTLPGIPAIYIHSLLGTLNWYEGVEHTGRARTINRRPLDDVSVEKELDTPGSFRRQVYEALTVLLKTRRRQPAFHPGAAMTVYPKDPRLFIVKRQCPSQSLLSVINMTDTPVSANISSIEGMTGKWIDRLSGKSVDLSSLEMTPYQVCWLTPA